MMSLKSSFGYSASSASSKVSARAVRSPTAAITPASSGIWVPWALTYRDRTYSTESSTGSSSRSPKSTEEPWSLSRVRRALISGLVEMLEATMAGPGASRLDIS